MVIDTNGAFRAISPVWTAVLGHQPEEVVGRSFQDVMWHDDLALSQSGLNSAPDRRDLNDFINRLAQKDRTPRTISWRDSTVGDFVYGSGREVTEEMAQAHSLELAAEALRQSQKMEAGG